MASERNFHRAGALLSPMSSPLRAFRRGMIRRALLIAGLLLVVVPSGAQAFSKMIWGDVYRHGKNQFPLYHQLGVSVFQEPLNWQNIAPTRPSDPTNPADPAYHWPAVIDQSIAQARRSHMQVMLQLITAPAWANGGHAPGNLTWSPQNPADFAAFAAAAARRYPTVRLWMVWGEPNRFGVFMPEEPAHDPNAKTLTPSQQQAPHSYAQILDAAYGALKGVSRHSLVIGGSTYALGAVTTWQWIKYMRLPNGRAPRMDIYAHNPFSYEAPSFSNPSSQKWESTFNDLPRLARELDRNFRRGLPIFLSEWTIPTAPDQEFNFYVDAPVAATWITDAMRISRRWHRIYGLGWIHVYDSPKPKGEIPQSTGGLIYANGKKKPGFWAFARG